MNPGNDHNETVNNKIFGGLEINGSIQSPLSYSFFAVTIKQL